VVFSPSRAGVPVAIVAGLTLLLLLSLGADRLRPPAADGPLPPGPGAPGAPGAGESQEAAAGLLDAWRRSRTSTYVVVSDFERTVGARRLEVTSYLAQRPPDRLTISGTSVRGRLDGDRVVCGPGADGGLLCERSPLESGYDEAVEVEVRRLERLVGPGEPVYAVAAEGGGCFRLRRVVAMVSPPYGDRARFCFDGATGALVASEVHRAEGTDRTTARELRAGVEDADLAVPSTIEELERVGE
jgi:hypothetical protein